MGKKQKTLDKMIGDFNIAPIIPIRISSNLLINSDYYEEIQDVYKKLGGQQDEFPINHGKYDLILNDIVIELDEQLHFNRYRKITLESDAYKDIKHFPLDRYIYYCEAHENKCLSAGGFGGKWSNNSCERQFGLAGSLKNLEGNGAPRWKQRAFYDFIKDIGSFIIRQKLIRLSIYDMINTKHGKILLIDILNKEQYQYKEELYKHILNIWQS